LSGFLFASHQQKDITMNGNDKNKLVTAQVSSGLAALIERRAREELISTSAFVRRTLAAAVCQEEEPKKAHVG
jgi:hypothetical protein